MMLPIFPGITRKQLKAKFRREEKINGSMIDKCLKGERASLDAGFFIPYDEEIKPKPRGLKYKGKKVPRTLDVAKTESPRDSGLMVDMTRIIETTSANGETSLLFVGRPRGSDHGGESEINIHMVSRRINQERRH
ncbi:hypothetical protein ACOME3_005715 [Neoechinorhynchus agilis]